MASYLQPQTPIRHPMMPGCCCCCLVCVSWWHPTYPCIVLSVPRASTILRLKSAMTTRFNGWASMSV